MGVRDRGPVSAVRLGKERGELSLPTLVLWPAKWNQCKCRRLTIQLQKPDDRTCSWLFWRHLGGQSHREK